jgi:glycosyltransferase involved in cell wall biosynthesis
MTEKTPLVSVIMSVYNGEEYLFQAIESILDQTFVNFEFLIMDDASDDNSLEILKHYSMIDTRIKIYTNKMNEGLPKSLNKLIKDSKGSLLARMDADDVSINIRFEKQYNFMRSNPNIGILGSNANLIDVNNNYICKKYTAKSIEKVIAAMPYHNYITHPSVMIRSSIIKQFGSYNEKYKTGQDWELWIRYINSGVKFEILEDRLLSFRINPKSISSWQSKNKAGGNLNLALLCLHNNARLDSFKYFLKLSYAKKFHYIIHFIIPFKIFLLIEKIYQLYYPKSPVNVLKKTSSKILKRTIFGAIFL